MNFFHSLNGVRFWQIILYVLLALPEMLNLKPSLSIVRLTVLACCIFSEDPTNCTLLAALITLSWASGNGERVLLCNNSDKLQHLMNLKYGTTNLLKLLIFIVFSLKVKKSPKFSAGMCNFFQVESRITTF